jgi:hypothetical protein
MRWLWSGLAFSLHDSSPRFESCNIIQGQLEPLSFAPLIGESPVLVCLDAKRIVRLDVMNRRRRNSNFDCELASRSPTTWVRRLAKQFFISE